MINDKVVSSSEIINRCFIYSDTKIINFKDIEDEIRKRTKKIHIHVFGEYNPKFVLKPEVYLEACYENIHYRIILRKDVIYHEDSSFYDYIARDIVHIFAIKYFGDVSDD